MDRQVSIPPPRTDPYPASPPSCHWLRRSPQCNRRTLGSSARRPRLPHQLRICLRGRKIEGQNPPGEHWQHLPLQILVQRSCRRPADSDRTPKRSSATVMADRKSVSSAWASSHSATRGSGSLRNGSDTTLVSTSIIADRSAGPERCRVARSRRTPRPSTGRAGRRRSAAFPARPALSAGPFPPGWRAPRPRCCDPSTPNKARTRGG